MAEEPVVVIEGLLSIIQRDLDKHKVLLEQTEPVYREYLKARKHEAAKRKNWESQIGNGKYDDEAMEKALIQIDINIRHFEDKMKLTKDEQALHRRIITKLEADIEEQEALLEQLRIFRQNNPEEPDALIH